MEIWCCKKKRGEQLQSGCIQNYIEVQISRSVAQWAGGADKDWLGGSCVPQCLSQMELRPLRVAGGRLERVCSTIYKLVYRWYTPRPLGRGYASVVVCKMQVSRAEIETRDGESIEG